MKSLKISTVFLMILALGTTSCANKKKQKQQNLDVKKSAIAEVVADCVYPLPSSFELMDMLNEIEAAYIIGISNPPADVEKYITPEKQAINLGVYMIDLSYAAVYHRKQTAQDYLTSCENLVRELHVDNAFQENFIVEVSENIDNKDTLVSIFTTTTQNVYSEFYKKEQTSLAALMVAGAWTEGMFLTLTVSDNTLLNTKIISTIIYQYQSLLKTIELLEDTEENATVTSVTNALKDIQGTFDGENPETLTEEQVKTLTTQATALRAVLIE